MSEKNPLNEKDVGKAILERLVKYTQYLYEEEKDRRTHLNGIMKIYLTFLTFTIGAVFLKSGTFNNNSYHPDSNLISGLIILLFSISAILILFSFICTVYVLKIRRYERLCNADEFVIKSTSFNNENRLLSAIISNYVIATERNHEINQKKAKFLSFALIFYMASIIVFVITFIGNKFIH